MGETSFVDNCTSVNFVCQSLLDYVIDQKQKVMSSAQGTAPHKPGGLAAQEHGVVRSQPGGGGSQWEQELKNWPLNEEEAGYADRFARGPGMGFVMPVSFEEIWIEIPENKHLISKKYAPDGCWMECAKDGVSRPDYGWWSMNNPTLEEVVGPPCPPNFNGDESMFWNCLRCVRCCTVCIPPIGPFKHGNPIEENFIHSYPGGSTVLLDVDKKNRERNFVQMYLIKKNDGTVKDRAEFRAWWKKEHDAALATVMVRIKAEKAADLEWVEKNYGSVAEFNKAVIIQKHSNTTMVNLRSPNWFYQ